MFVLAHGWGIQPSEFYKMTMGEFMSLYNHYVDQNRRNSGLLSVADERELREWVENG